MEPTDNQTVNLEEERIEVPDVAPAFADGGPIARTLGARYRQRAGQVEMAQLVRQALVENKAALVEAGTGCGKSFAYLLPVLTSGARAFVSTANKTLQTQLWEKDVPALRQALSRPFTAALLKGRSNYVCRFRLGETRKQMALPGMEDSLARLIKQLPKIPSGDVEDLRLPGRLREAVTAGQHDCLGKECPHLAACYYEQAKQRAEKADLVIVNHALLAYNLVSPFLSPRPVVVVDEAHELERFMVSALRLSLEYDMTPQLVNDNMVMRHIPDTLRSETIRSNHQLFGLLSQPPTS